MLDMLRRRKLAVVLSGGAMLGAFQVGVIEALSGAGIVPDLIVGTSVGAVNGVYWAFHPGENVARRLLEIWLTVDEKVLFPEAPLAVLHRLLRCAPHITTQEGIRRLIASQLPEHALIEEAAVPVVLVATDAATGERVPLRSGPVWPALLASTAIPGLFPPVTIGGHDLVDGGVVANADVQSAVEAGTTDVVVVDLMGEIDGPPEAPSVRTAVGRAVVHSLQRQTDLIVAACSRQARIALLRARYPALPKLGDFSRTQLLHSDGLEAGLALLRDHLRGRRVIPGRVDWTAPPLRSGLGAPAPSEAPA